MSIEKQLLDMVESTGIGAGKLDTKQLQNLIIKIPPKDVRESITAIAKNIDDKLIINQQTNQTLEAIAQTIFKSWFVDFDPVKAKLSVLAAGGSAEEAERAAMCAISARDEASLNTLQIEQPEAYAELAQTAALFPSAMQNSELGEIPEGWKISNISQIADVIDCLHSKKPSQLSHDNGCLYLQLNNIGNDGLLNLEKKFFISEEDYKKWIKRIEVKDGDCIITNVGRVGAVAIIPRNVKASIGRNITAIRVKGDQNISAFLITLLTSSFMKREIEFHTDVGTILNALNVKNIPKLRFIDGGEALLSNFEKKVSPILRQRQANIDQNLHLASTRDALLPKLLTGEIFVKNEVKEAMYG